MQIFENPEFGQVRMIEEDGKRLFCGKDIAAALGYSHTVSAIKQHCRERVKRRVGVGTGTKADGSPAIQQVEMSFIPESDVYRLITQSKLPAAEKFKKWIFDNILSAQSFRPASIVTSREKPILEGKSMKNDENCSHMPELIPIEREGVRVLLTSQLAEAYETTTDIISQNFKRNKTRYTEGKHYFVLERDALKEFKITNPQFDDQFKHAPKVYLWTGEASYVPPVFLYALTEKSAVRLRGLRTTKRVSRNARPLAEYKGG